MVTPLELSERDDVVALHIPKADPDIPLGGGGGA